MTSSTGKVDFSPAPARMRIKAQFGVYGFEVEGDRDDVIAQYQEFRAFIVSLSNALSDHLRSAALATAKPHGGEQ